MLLCGKQPGFTALIDLDALESRRNFLKLQAVFQHILCKKNDILDCNNYPFITYYQLQTHKSIQYYSL